jgi:hypothetical protein
MNLAILQVAPWENVGLCQARCWAAWAAAREKERGKESGQSPGRERRVSLYFFFLFFFWFSISKPNSNLFLNRV